MNKDTKHMINPIKNVTLTPIRLMIGINSGDISEPSPWAMPAIHPIIKNYDKFIIISM
jgi:hypothetical protein